MKRWNMVALAAGGWILTGCSDGIPLEELPSALADVYCSSSEACLGRLAGGGSGRSGCRESSTHSLANRTVAQWEDAVERGTAVYDPALAAECVSQQRALGCDLSSAAEPAVCREFLSGTLALGEPCSISEECEGDAYCDPTSCTCAGRKDAGATCRLADECSTGLTCPAGTCRAPMSGAPCFRASAGCPRDEFCLGGAALGGGTCTPYATAQTRAVDETCDPYPAALELCAPDLSCAVVGGDGIENERCVESVASGASCFAAFPVMCPAGEYCDAQPDAGVFEGTCRPLPGEGEPCVSTVGNSFGACAAGLRCTLLDSICVAPRSNGETCESSEDCASFACSSGECVAPTGCTLRP